MSSQDDPTTTSLPPPPANSTSAAPGSSKPAALNIPKNRSVTNLASRTATGARASYEGSVSGEYDLRSPILPPERDSGLRRIRQQAPARNPSSPNLHALGSTSPSASAAPSRKASLTLLGPSSPVFPFHEDLHRFPSESLHSFSFAHRSSESLSSRQNVLKRSIDFMREKLNWAATSPRIASAQAKLAGDEELLGMMELLQKANVLGLDGSFSTGIGMDRGPLTGPVLMDQDNVFERSFLGPLHDMGESPVEEGRSALLNEQQQQLKPGSLSPRPSLPIPNHPVIREEEELDFLGNEPEALDFGRRSSADRPSHPDPPAARRASLKRTYTDISGLSLQHKLSDALAQPFYANKPPTSLLGSNAPTFQPQPPPLSRTNTAASAAGERAPHGHKNNQAQAIFTTGAESPWTITAANDLACLVFGVTRAEVRKLGIMEVISKDRRNWLEEKLRNPDSGTMRSQTTKNLAPEPASAPSSRKTSPTNSIASMGNGVTAKLLAKPPVRQNYQSRRSQSQSQSGASTPRSPPPKPTLTPPPPPPPPPPTAQPQSTHQPGHKDRGVLLCGDVVPIRKMNGATGSASLWVKEKGNNLIWVLEEIVEDVAYLTVDEIGSVVRGSGAVEPIFGLERARRGMDVQKLIPNLPKLRDTNTGALDYEEIARLRRFTARTANSISIPITVDQVENEAQFRVSSFPHIAGIIVLNPTTMRVSSSNSVFSAALFGHANPDGLPITELIPGFDNILHLMTDEEKIGLVDGIVIPEHSFRRARALLALREGSADAASIFLRPSGLPAKHRDGAEIMVDVQMRVVKSDREPIYNETAVEQDGHTHQGGEIVYALWITYSRQLHAVNHGIGPVTPAVSRPSTPPTQPGPGPNPDESEPSPIMLGMSADSDEPPLSLLTQSLTSQAKATIMDDDTGIDNNEPFEHPSADMIAAGAKTIKKKKIEDFTILEEMGQGAYGQVKLARYKRTAAKKMVIKYVTKRRILVDTWHRDRRLGTVPLEIHVLDYLRRDGLQHPNIVQMADFFEDDINYYIEMVPHGLPGMDLFDYIELRVTMEEQECRKIFRQVAEAIRHLHLTAKVVHRDIKDENVILDGEGRVKLVDFGSAAYIKSGPFDVFVGTIDYAAPEVLRGSPYRGKEQDVWALGILLYTIVYKENPFYSIDEIMDHDLRVPYVMSEEALDLIRKMLDRDVERRIGIHAVLEHPWLLHPDEDEDGQSDSAPLV